MELANKAVPLTVLKFKAQLYLNRNTNNTKRTAERNKAGMTRN